MSVSGELLCSFELLKPLDSSALKSHIKKGRNKRNNMLNSPVSHLSIWVCWRLFFLPNDGVRALWTVYLSLGLAMCAPKDHVFHRLSYKNISNYHEACVDYAAERLESTLLRSVPPTKSW